MGKPPVVWMGDDSDESRQFDWVAVDCGALESVAEVDDSKCLCARMFRSGACVFNVRPGGNGCRCPAWFGRGRIYCIDELVEPGHVPS